MSIVMDSIHEHSFNFFPSSQGQNLSSPVILGQDERLPFNFNSSELNFDPLPNLLFENLSNETSLWFEKLDIVWWSWFHTAVFQAYAFHIVALYIASIYILRKFRRNLGAVDNKALKYLSIVYFSIHVSFSVLCTWRMLPQLVSLWINQGTYDVLCTRNRPLMEAEVFWITGYNLTKIFLLVETFLMVLQKKRPSLFHIFHHSIMIVLSSHVSHFYEPFIVLFGTLNALQHCLIYPLPLMKALGFKLPRKAGIFVMIIEMVYMLVAVGGSAYTTLVQKRGGYCMRHPTSTRLFNFAIFGMLLLVLCLLMNALAKILYKRKKSKTI